MIEINDIETGDNLLVSSNSWIAKIIKKFQKNKWNHSAMFWRAYDELFVIEADKHGIAITPFIDYINSNKDLLILKTKFYVDGSEYGKFMLPFVGHHPYGFFNLVIAQSIRILTSNRIWIGPNRKKDPKRFICGEWTAYVYEHFNEGIFPNWNRIAPVDIYNSIDFIHYDFIKK